VKYTTKLQLFKKAPFCLMFLFAGSSRLTVCIANTQHVLLILVCRRGCR